MKVLYFDCFSGISGDMTLGALLDLGIDKDLFLAELSKLKLSEYDITVEKKEKHGISGTDVEVIINKEYGNIMKRMELNGHFTKVECDHHHSIEESKHHNIYNPEHNHTDDSDHHHFSRNLKDIEIMIDDSALNERVKSLSKRVFREIARAEAKVHNKGIYDVHFHEVGAVDSIVDIVGIAICLDILNIEEVYASPLHDGQGVIECAHGLIPVPVPAVLEILSNSQIPLIIDNIHTELITPTGAGVIKTICRNFGSMPVMLIDKVGYGFGKREIGRLNALRVVIGTVLGQDCLYEEISLLETNIDDTTAEMLGFTMEKLFYNGALDVFFTPIYMKKNRPAYKLSVLSNKQTEEKLVDIILTETSSIGVRKTPMTRYSMERETVRIDTQYGEVRVKVSRKGDIKKYSPEYEDCREIAIKSGEKLATIYEMVNRRANEMLKE